MPCQCFVSVCLCAPAYVYTSTEEFGSIFKVDLESWKSASLSSHGDQSELPEIHLQQYGGLEGRMRRQVLSVP